MDDSLILTELEQVRVLADALRLRLLELFKDRELTIKQAAKVLDEKPSRLYHHVDLLEQAGLIRVVNTRPIRGTVERYYRALARSIVVSPSLFAVGEPEGAGSVVLAGMMTSVLDAARETLARGISTGVVGGRDSPPPVLVHLPVRATPEGAERIRQLLASCVQGVRAEMREEGDPYSFTLAYFPVARSTTPESCS